MKFIRTFDRYITALFFLTIIAIVFTSYFTLKEVLTKYNKNQHQAIVPLFSLINSEIIRPLDTAFLMANDTFIIEYIEQDKIVQEKIINYLSRLSIAYKMVTFIAMDKHGYLLNSNKEKLALGNNQMEWYERLKNKSGTQFADIGNAEDPHLYFDIKIFNEQQKFLGFIGVAVDLNHFAKKFTEYQHRFGFELILVDNSNNITLSSNSLMKTESHHRDEALVNIEQFNWYQALSKEKMNNNSVQSVEFQGQIISQLPLNELNWRIFIISPPAYQQGEYWKLFTTRIGIFISLILILYALFNLSVGNLKKRLVENSEIDFLTKLPNRSYMHWKYEELIESHKHIALAIADIDNFKVINDTYGHVVGDEVLRVIAKQFSENLRQDDISCRWGGEEFVMLLPNSSAKQALEITERMRETIAKTPFNISASNLSFNTTISFGIYESPLTGSSLEELVKNADKALYKAKHNGRNRVEIYKD